MFVQTEDWQTIEHQPFPVSLPHPPENGCVNEHCQVGLGFPSCLNYLDGKQICYQKMRL